MPTSYWETVLDRRISRRRGLMAAGGSAAAAAFLAACGGGGTSTPPEEASGLVTKPVDETKIVKRGGTIRGRANFELVHLDPMVTGNHTGPAPALYSNFVRISDGYMEPTNGDIEGDVLESWEVSGDKMAITFKVSPGASFHDVAPINGRKVDARDVAFSWERFVNVGTRSIEYANSKSADAPIVSVTAVDDRTVLMKLKEPNATVLALLAQVNPGALFVVPKETDSGVFDIRTKPIGSGPWALKEWKPGEGYTYKRHTGFKQDKRGDIPYVDEVNFPTIQEAAVFQSQFRTGNVLSGGGLRAEDILPIKREIPELEMMTTDMDSVYMRTFFGQLGPFKDERLRQAWVLTYDRDLFLDVYFNVSKFEAEGLPVETAWDAALHAEAYKGWPLDPKSKDFGPNSKYFHQDLAEAKKLMAAAGYANGITTTVNQASTNGYPAEFYKQAEIILGMVRDSGLFKFEIEFINYAAEWTPRFRNIKGQFDTVAQILDTATPDPANYLFTRFNSSGALYQGGDSKLDEMTKQAVIEFDNNKRRSIVHEIQRYEAAKALFPLEGGATGFSLQWPALRGQRVWQGGSGRANATNWIDDTKPPFKKA